MKKLMAVMLIAALLSGCSWMDGSYVSVTPHVVSSNRSENDTRWIRSYSQLLSALTDLVDSGATQGHYSLVDYPQDRIRNEMESAIEYLTLTHPIGAYAVDSIDYEYSSGGSSNILAVDVVYRQGRTDTGRILTVRGIEGARKAIANAMRQFDSSVVLQITDYTDTDFAQLAAQFAMETPEAVMETPQVSYSVYPNRGSIRVVEITFTYQTSREDLKTMLENVLPIFSSAQLYISINEGDSVKLNQLYTFLTERFDYTIQTSITPAYSLLYHGVGDSRAFARVYATMCRQVGLECKMVTGTKGGESRCWNMVQVDGIWYHMDILRCMDEGGYRQYTDAEMQDYVWDYSAYPTCGISEAEATQPTAP